MIDAVSAGRISNESKIKLALEAVDKSLNLIEKEIIRCAENGVRFCYCKFPFNLKETLTIRLKEKGFEVEPDGSKLFGNNTYYISW